MSMTHEQIMDAYEDVYFEGRRADVVARISARAVIAGDLDEAFRFATKMVTIEADVEERLNLIHTEVAAMLAEQTS